MKKRKQTIRKANESVREGSTRQWENESRIKMMRKSENEKE